MQRLESQKPSVKKQALSDEQKIRLAQKLSARHRDWGWDVPALDIDFLMTEYDRGKPIAIIEYKHESAQMLEVGHPSYKSITELANNSKIPFYIVIYADDFSWFRVLSINAYTKVMQSDKKLSELEYVEFLYRIRGRNVPSDLVGSLNDRHEERHDDVHSEDEGKPGISQFLLGL